MSMILKYLGLGKKPPIEREMMKLKYIDIKKSYEICHGTVCWINQSQSLFFIYEEINAINQYIYRIGYVYEDIDSLKEETFNSITYKMKSHTWELKIVQQIQRKENQINIYLPASLDSDMNIKFDSDQLADKWYVLLINSQNCEKQKRKKIEKEQQADFSKKSEQQETTILLPVVNEENGIKQNVPSEVTSTVETQEQPNQQALIAFLPQQEATNNKKDLNQPFRQSSFGHIVSNAANQVIPKEIFQWLKQQN